MNTEKVIAAIEKIANPALQAHWDKSGLQVTSERAEVTSIAVMLDPLPATIKRALEAGCDFILSHHPLSLKPGLPCQPDNYFHALRLLMRANTALYAAHTSLDVNLAGPAGWPGRELGLTGTVPLEPIGDGYGYGEVGDLPEPVPFGILVNRILKLVKTDCANLAGPEGASKCLRVAYCGGSGASLLKAAAESGADLFFTGDIKYHTALEATLPVLDVGHHSIEEEMMRRFALLLGEELPGISINFFKSASPFRLACQ